MPWWAASAPPDFRFSRPLRARRNRRLRETIEKSGSLRSRPRTCGRGEDHHGRESCRGARHEGTQDTPHRSRPQANSSISFRGPRHDRSQHGRRDRPIRRASSLNHPADPRDASEPVRRTREDRALAKLEARLVGELDAHFPIEDKIDKLGRDYARRLRLSAGSRAARRFNVLVNPVLRASCRVRDHDARQADRLGAGHPGTDPEGRTPSPVLVEEAVIESARTADFTTEPADNERLQKWLESLDSEELGKYEMQMSAGRRARRLTRFRPLPTMGAPLPGIALCGPFSDNRLDLVLGEACRDRVLR